MRPSMAGKLGSSAFVALVALASCKDHATTAKPNASVEAPAASAATATATAAATKSPLTTDGAIALGNLDTQIRGAERLAAQRPQDPDFSGRAVELLLDRATFRGTVADLDRALDLAEAAAKAAPDKP